MNIDLLLKIAERNPEHITDDVIERIKQTLDVSALFLLANILKDWSFTPITVNDYLNFRGTNIKSLGNLKRISSWLDLKGTKITSLGDLEYVGGWLDLEGTKITSLDKLTRVAKNLYLENSTIRTLNKLEYVGYSLILTDCVELETLGKLEYVGGTLDLRGTNIRSLGNLENVHSIICDDENQYNKLIESAPHLVDKMELKEPE